MLLLPWLYVGILHLQSTATRYDFDDKQQGFSIWFYHSSIELVCPYFPQLCLQTCVDCCYPWDRNKRPLFLLPKWKRKCSIVQRSQSYQNFQPILVRTLTFFLLYLEGSEGMGHNAPNTFPMKVDRPQEQELPDTGSPTFGGTASQIS